MIWILLYIVLLVAGSWLFWKGYYAFLGAAKRSLNEAADSRARAQGKALADALKGEQADEAEAARIERLEGEIANGEALAASLRALAEANAALAEWARKAEAAIIRESGNTPR